MFDKAKLETAFKAALAVKALPDGLSIEDADVDGQPAAMVRSGNKHRVFTEADLNSPKLGAQIKHFMAGA